jgi:probable HAF family extracellular repeat protein
MISSIGREALMTTVIGRSSSARIWAGLGLLLTVSGYALAGSPTYTAVPTLPDTSTFDNPSEYQDAYALNDNGQTVGSCGQDLGNYGACLVGNGKAHLIPFPSDCEADPAGYVAYAVNSSGTAAGFCSYNVSPAAFFGSVGIASILGAATPYFSIASGINDLGQATGYLSSTGDHAFLYSAGTLTYLGGLGGVGSHGAAINASGQITGDADVSSGTAHHAFLYSRGTMSDLGTLGGTNSAGAAINARGAIVGNSDITGDAAHHAFMYAAGAMTDLGTLGGPNSSATGINDSGQIVGFSDTKDGKQHAFVWAGGVMSDLNAVVDPGNLRVGSYFDTAAGINSGGVILADSYLVAPVRFSPASLDFGNQPLATTSAPRPITVANTGTMPFAISSITASAGLAQTNNCPAAIAVGASCTINVEFTPANPDAQPGSITVASNAISFPLAVSGNGLVTVAISASAASVAPNVPVALTWKASPGTACTATSSGSGDGWSGSVASSGTRNVTEMAPGTYNFVLQCVAGMQTVKATAAVSVVSPSPGGGGSGGGGGALDLCSLFMLLAFAALRCRPLV